MKAVRCSARAGSALLLSLWCIAVLSITVLAVARMVVADVDDEGLQNRRFEARELALTGLAYGMNPKIELWDPLLDQRFPDGGRLRVRITSEGARLDINRLLKERGQKTLRRLFEIWNVPSDLVSIASDSLVDWTDADDLRSLNGAEREDLLKQSQYSLPANRDFRSVVEMEKVRGMDAVAAAKPDWAGAFTVHGGRRVDLQEASIDVMRAAGGLSTEDAQRIDQVRLGPDRLPQTRDDYKIKSVADFLERMGVSELDRKRAQTAFSAGTGPARIESKATVSGTTYTIVVIAVRGNGTNREPAMLDWEEQ
ncbi:MAG: type II secretion system protein GspK [Terrimicrobiaceae bacterium]|nr:type II secretion system protein GspK [Terrimicrobiaceae bacterium]